MYLKQTQRGYEDPKTIPDAKYPERKIKPKGNGSFFNKDSVGFLVKGAAGMGGLGYGVKKLNDINDHPNNISDFDHVGKLFHIGENDSGGFSVASSSGPMPAVGGIGGASQVFPPLKELSPIDKVWKKSVTRKSQN